MYQNMTYIDSHSHFTIEDDTAKIGVERFWPKAGSIEEYCNLAKANNIVQSMLMPCPTPQIITESSVQIPFCWEERNGKIAYFSATEANGVVEKREVQHNPYMEINSLLWKYVQEHSFGGLKIHFVPMLNLVFDEEEYLQGVIERGAKALKIHGISSAIDDFGKINHRLLKVIERYDIPLIIHTDYYDGLPNNALQRIYKMNDPINWINLLERYNVRALLTHGIRLCKESARLINNSDKYFVGISPDLLLTSEPDRLKQPHENYLRQLFSLIDVRHILFDIDFPWNVDNRTDYGTDYNFIGRLKSEHCISSSELELVANANAKYFFDI